MAHNITSHFAKPRFLKWALVLAIIIILNLFFVFSVKLVYETPHYDDFCEPKQVHIIPETQEECLEIGGQWVEGRFIQRGLPHPARIEPPVIEEEVKGYCNEDFTCRQEFQDARQLYERNFFVALVVLGTITLIGSFILRSFEAIAPAFSAGGVLTLIIASIRYWSDMDDYLRVIVLGIALAALIWVGARKFRK